MKVLAVIAGVAMFLLGGLWLLQGLGAVDIAPIACVAECAPLTGPSLQWTFIGAGAMTVGAILFVYGLRHLF